VSGTRPYGEAARVVAAAFQDYQAQFRHLTRLARRYFEARNWRGGQEVSVRRLDIYRAAVAGAVASLRRLLGEGAQDRSLWREMKATYAGIIGMRHDPELAETFFNSVTRRSFTIVGVDPEVEFVRFVAAAAPGDAGSTILERFERSGTVGDLLRNVLSRHPFSVGYEDLERDVRLAAAAVETQAPGRVEGIDLVESVFFRNKGAYLVGRLRTAAGPAPLLVALTNPEGRVVVDAVLTTENDASVVFSYTRSYFMVETERPGELVGFLSRLMPRKPVSELYSAIGHNKHGKTELFRDLLGHLSGSDDRFEIAPGARGMVMLVFTLPSFDVVFKIIRDSFDEPKTTTRAEVMGKYQLVFQHDRAGRLVDAQEFEHLRFDRAQFSPGLVEELVSKVAGSVAVEGESVVLHHLYTERRVTPLDLYLRQAGEDAAMKAVLDYGQALRDLAATNIFPGDLLLKNFGVTRHGRVVFYDYDEICRVTDCRFRDMPQASGPEEEAAGEAWFYVGEHDIFPEELLGFLGLPRRLREAFLEAHGELLTVGFWEDLQRRHLAGDVPDLFPYPPERRLRPA
jgi:isocitrate dehydrogenase kinase/phosphatase